MPQSGTVRRPEPPPRHADPRVQPARMIVARLFGDPASRAFAVRYWDGTEDRGPSVPAFTLVVRRPGALRRILLPPSELALVEAYLRDDMDIEGSLEAASTLGDLFASGVRKRGVTATLLSALCTLPRDDAAPPDRGVARAQFRYFAARRASRHSKEVDAAAVRFHYDVSNDFYRLWLDERMQYSCAYFRTGRERLDDAQDAKLEHICRKLRLRPGQRLLDIGCGWGGLLLYASQRHGVTGVGITLSEAQARVARERIAAAGLADRCRVEVRDYRDLSDLDRFDKVVSVGMREHVGRRNMPSYFRAAYGALVPGGLFLDHGIVRGGAAEVRGIVARAVRRLWRRDVFVRKYVFPGGELMTLAGLVGDAEGVGFETRDVENLREHYVLTLRHWVRRLEARHAEAAAIVGERTFRIWRLYMAATVLAFRSGRITLCQTLYVKPTAAGASHLPLTRADLHRADLHRAGGGIPDTPVHG